MWRGPFINKNICLVFALIVLNTESHGQAEYNAFITKHNLQSLTARTSYQNILIDHNGLMYIATSDGIFLYNGSSEQFIDNSENAGTHVVTSMVEDALGIIWIACDDGLIFHIKNKKMSVWLPQEGLPKHKICKMLLDDKNQLWIATKGEGVYVFNRKYLYHFGYEDGLRRLEINDMFFLKGKGILISSDRGLQLLNFNNGIKQVDKFEMNCIDERDIIQDLEIFDGALYLNDLSKGIIRQAATNDCEVVWYNKHAELALTMSASDAYRVFLTDQALYVESFGEKKEIRKHRTLPNNMEEKPVMQIAINKDIDLSEIQRIVIDDKNTLWILLKNLGLMSVFLPITRYPVKDRTVQDVTMSSDGKQLLLCTDSELHIIRVADGNFVSRHYSGENLTSIFSDANPDVFWIGSYGQGLIRFNLLTREGKRFKKENGLPDNNILQICGNDRYIWITTLGGIMRIDNTGKAILSNPKIYNHQNGLPTNFIYKTAADKTDRLWIATDGNGINYINKDAYCIEPIYNSTRTQSIYNLEYDEKNYLYFNASGMGLGLLDIRNDSISSIETPLKNPEYDCISLINDSIMLGAGNGFLVLSNPRRALSITMDEEFGLHELVPALNAIYRDEFENIWIGCTGGLIRIQPEVQSILSRPENSFSGIRVNDIYIDYTVDSVFEHYENQISLEFNAVHYLASDHLDYRYKLEEYDKEWIYSKEGNKSYSSLRPGSYKFMVQSSINKHFDNSNEISFSFSVLKPYWLQWWFIAICGIAFVVLIQYIQKRRVLHKTREEAIRRKTSELEFEILKSQVNPHFLFNSFNSVISLIEDDKDKAIEFTEKLSDYFRNILKYRDTHLISLPEEMTILLNYLELLRLRHPDQIEFEKENIQPNAYIAPMTLQLLMENAIKHNEISLKTPLRISVYCRDEFLVFSNSIIHRKLNEDSTGFGLESIRLRYKLLTEKEIRIEERDDYFSVEIPLLYKMI